MTVVVAFDRSLQEASDLLAARIARGEIAAVAIVMILPSGEMEVRSAGANDDLARQLGMLDMAKHHLLRPAEG